MEVSFYVAAVVKPPCVCFSSLHAFGAVSHGPDRSGSFLWRWDLLSPTTFYPCGFNTRHPILPASFDESWKACGRRPHLSDGFLCRPGNSTGRLHQHHGRSLTRHRHTAYASLSSAPSGKTPVSRKRHSAMSNLRATATIPIRLKRFPPPPKRSRNQPLSALSG